ncbi:ligase-associated DNA damage response DEXH box helicase [Zavarzinia sp. CC-PAN008]|uniref:ligase-associated DNA damage response DEXH box helicase n=1 Tax=Zavarzinia sp. CC-PAN008 TaxID=3243332 RepID=UPI003F749960
MDREAIGDAHALLPHIFTDWFAGRGWAPRAHQLGVLAAARPGAAILLVAPTGGGKTLAGFLPSLVDLAGRAAPRPGEVGRGLHTLYISPLKALAVDVARNLEEPVAEMGLPISVETRTGDTPAAKKGRQRRNPPDILLTTPEQLALLLSFHDADRMFRHLKAVVIDEVHALWTTKRGDLLALDLARLDRLAPKAWRIGLSATIADRPGLARWLGGERPVTPVEGAPGAPPQLTVLQSEAHVPWSGHSARHSYPELMNAIRGATTALVFVNTRSQAELIFQNLWRINDDGLPIALHHGSLAPEQRRKVEAAMAKGRLRAVVATSTLDLGIDWGAVDLVIQVGAPKGCSRMVQRIGRANHRLDEPSRALLVPANRFEFMECRAAVEAVAEGALDGDGPRTGALDVLAQHIMGMAVAGGFNADQLYDEIRTAAPYAAMERDAFDAVLDFVATGGYALKSYERWRRLARDANGVWKPVHAAVARRYRLNIGTIVEVPMISVRLNGGRVLGQVEEAFIEALTPGDSFVFAGEVLRFDALRETSAIVSRSTDAEPKVPSYAGGKFPLSTFLADRVRRLLADGPDHPGLPPPVAEWLAIQKRRSLLPRPDQLLIETFPRAKRFYMVAYPFEGRLAHQTLGMLLTRRMERRRLKPLGFVASEYALAVWSLEDAGRVDLGELFDQDMLGDDLEDWLAESNLMKRTFRNVALISGLIERRHPGQEKNGRQVTFSTDLIYDVLRRHQPDHVLMKATWADAATGLLDVRRLGEMLGRAAGHIVHRRLERVSPLAVPVLLDIGREAVPGGAIDDLLSEAAEDLIAEAMME